MGLHIATRSSDSPWISSVWTSRSEGVSEMTSVASETWGLVFWVLEGRSFAAVTGPESRAATAPVPSDATFVGIQFAVGTSLRMTSTSEVVDSGIELPDTTGRSFWLDGARWQTPNCDDAEALVARLVRNGALGRDQIVAAALSGTALASSRTLERRFRVATGLTRGAIDQIQRARLAAERLTKGERIFDVVSALDYYDEPHLARALRRYIGRTAGQLRGGAAGVIALPELAHDVVDGLHDPVAVGR